MKRLICILLALSLVLALSACSILETSETTAAPTEPPVETLAPTESEEPEATEPMPVTVVNNRVDEVSTLEDTAYDFTLSYSDVIVSTGNVGVDMVIRNDLAADLTETREAAVEIITRMQDMLSNSQELLSSSSVTRVIMPSRVDERILSFNGYLSQYLSGGSHPSTTLKSMTYDVATGNRLTLWDVTKDGDQIAALKELVLNRLAEQEAAQDLGFFPGYEETVELHFDPEDPNSESWYLTDEGIVCYFSAYELASYAVGPLEVLVTYEELPELIRPGYLPVEAAPADGEVIGYLAKDGAPNYAAVQNWEGAQIDLATDGYVTDLRVETVAPINEGETYEATDTLFAANWLEGGKVIRVFADIPDTLYNLRVSYTGASGKVVRYITQSGEDGSVLLVEA